MKLRESISLEPISVEKSVRAEEVRCLTSCRAGSIIPVAFFPVLREDRVTNGSLRLKFKMDETVQPLLNAVNVSAYAHFVPFLAFDRFDGMDSFNRSYKGIPEPSTGSPIAFNTTMAYHKDDPFWNKLGVQWPEGTQINKAPVEAFNVLVNHRRNSRTTKLPQRGNADVTLPQAFWKNPNLWYIVPDFDSEMLDGEVPLTIGNLKLPLHSSGAFKVGGTAPNEVYAPVGPGGFVPPTDDGKNWGDYMFTRLKDAMASVSLANIEVAKQTAAFAKLREQFNGLSDDHVIDLLMQGIRVPDEMMKQPILLDRSSTIFGYSERHAMDGPSMDQSVTTGTSELTLNFRTPPMNTGGLIFITVEIVPEQLFERKQDLYLKITDPLDYPDFLRDYLDPEKVETVPNSFVDVYHSDPSGLFGYAPTNHQWKRSLVRVGGRYFRPNPDTFVEDRQRIWAVEQTDPTLTEDFYLCPVDFPHTPFVDMDADPFEIVTLGRVEFVGNTVFGPALEEDNSNYEAVASKVDLDRIEQEAEAALQEGNE